MIINPSHWPTLTGAYGFLWIPYFIYFRRIQNIRLQRCLLLAPLWLAINIRYADVIEIRTDSEWIPYLVVCLASIVHNSFTRSEADTIVFAPIAN